MELSALSNVDLINAFQVPTISSSLGGDETTSVSSSNGAFESLFNSAANMISEANDYSNAAEEEEIKYSLGETESIHDLQIAQQKANILTVCCCRQRFLYVRIQRADEPAILSIRRHVSLRDRLRIGVLCNERENTRNSGKTGGVLE
jgi:flagellar hook-basal body complex protein FliE